jgi:hypothetical protein
MPSLRENQDAKLASAAFISLLAVRLLGDAGPWSAQTSPAFSCRSRLKRSDAPQRAEHTLWLLVEERAPVASESVDEPASPARPI